MSAADLPLALQEIHDTLFNGKASIRQEYVFNHGFAWQVMDGSRKVGPLLLPPEEGKPSDTLRLLADLMDETAGDEIDRDILLLMEHQDLTSYCLQTLLRERRPGVPRL